MEGFFKGAGDGLAKAYTFLTSRRVWLLGLLAALLAVLGFAGLDANQAAEIVEAAGGSVDATLGVLVALTVLVERLGALVGLIVVAYKAMSSFDTRPPTLKDYLPSPK